MKASILVIIFCICLYSKADATQLDNNPLLGTWTFTDDESEREDDCFTVYRLEFQENSECSHWNDIGVLSTGNISISNLIFKGIFNCNPEKKEIIIYIDGDKDVTLKMAIIKLTEHNLSVADEGGNRMDFQKKR